MTGRGNDVGAVREWTWCCAGEWTCCVVGMDVMLRGGMDVLRARGSGGSGEQGIFAVWGQSTAINQSGPFGRVIDATPLAASDGANPLAFLRCG